MRDGIASQTAYGAGRLRAAHQKDHPLVFQDPFAIRFLKPEDAQALQDKPARGGPFLRALRTAIAARSRLVEDELHEAVARGVTQYIVLGAGFDTFAFRTPYPREQLRIFEVDHPDTQAAKRRVTLEAGLDFPDPLTLVPVDFASDSLAERLDLLGFDFKQPAFISFLGVSMYLETAALEQTLMTLATRCAKGTEIIFDYLVAPTSLGLMDRLAQQLLAWRVARMGEPLRTRFDPEALPARLKALGFSEAAPVDSTALQERIRQENDLPASHKPPRMGMGGMMRAVV
jgi:methyltransferase (TIGR00027 family)